MQQESGEPGPGPGRTSLARYKSAPATWLEALLEDEVDDENDLLKHHHHHNQSLTQLLASDTAPKNSADFPTSAADPSSVFYDAAGTSSSGFARQNSSPAEFLGSGDDVDGYFSSYGGGGGGASFGYLGGSGGGGTIGRDASALKYSSHLKVEQGARLPSRMSSMPEPDMDKLLEDSVPFRVRAKRGCATHPRSIAERVRRTKISDRIRKLQELVPNMDKQTNTADMLDEAVEYVKYLQKQIQELNEQQKKCKCTIKD